LGVSGVVGAAAAATSPGCKLDVAPPLRADLGVTPPRLTGNTLLDLRVTLPAFGVSLVGVMGAAAAASSDKEWRLAVTLLVFGVLGVFGVEGAAVFEVTGAAAME
jgi:hypothetical protein